MKVTGQSVSTPRSNTMTGMPVSHAASTAGVSVAVVLGDTISASQSPLPVSVSMSEICLSSAASASRTSNSAISGCSSTSACMVVKPTCRHGLSTEALEKHTFHGPGVAYCAVSTISGSMACSHGASAGPSGSMSRMASWASISSWSKNSDSVPPWTSVVSLPPVSPVALSGSSESSVHAPASNAATAIPAISRRFLMVVPSLSVVWLSGSC